MACGSEHFQFIARSNLLNNRRVVVKKYDQLVEQWFMVVNTYVQLVEQPAYGSKTYDQLDEQWFMVVNT